MSIDSGRLRHRVTLEKFDYVRDSNGDVVQDPESGETLRVWVVLGLTWAAIEPLSAREFIASQAVQSKVTGKIILWYRADVDTTCRALHNGKIYQIEGVLPDKDSGIEYLTFMVSQGVNDGQ